MFAFELKSKAYIERKDFSGLKAFKKDYPIAQCYLIYAGEHAEKHEEITAIPMQQILFKLPKILKNFTKDHHEI